MSEHLNPQFLTTRWTLLLGSKEESARSPSQALITLCENYRYPVLVFIRKWCDDPEKAEDLCQSFFEFLIEKKLYQNADPIRGRFRTFLLTSVRNFLHNSHRHTMRKKRGGDQIHLSVDHSDWVENQFSQFSSSEIADTFFDHEWAITVFDKVWNFLEKEYQQANQVERFGILQHTLAGNSDSLSYQEIAKQLGITEGGVKKAVFRMRARFREVFHMVVSQLVDNPNDVDDEIDYLIQAMTVRI